LFSFEKIMTMPTVLTTIIIYARNIHKTVAFYSHHFGFETTGAITEGLVELKASQGGINILVHQAAKSVKLGQAGVKLSFDVEDIAAFVLAAQAQGLAFGTIHKLTATSLPIPKIRITIQSAFLAALSGITQLFNPETPVFVTIFPAL
jgi:predicted enzyme related to lactoylglutathione lyase